MNNQITALEDSLKYMEGPEREAIEQEIERLKKEEKPAEPKVIPISRKKAEKAEPVKEEPKKEETKKSLFGSAKVKPTTVAATKEEKTTVVVPGLEEKLLAIASLKGQIKDLEAQFNGLNGEVKDISKDKFVDLYKQMGNNPNTFYIKDGNGCIMVIPTDRYISVKDEARAEQLKKEYGANVVTTTERFYFTPAILERNKDAIEKLIMDATTISEADKENLITKEVTYSVAKGTIDQLAKYGNRLENVLDDVQPIFQLKDCGGKAMAEGGEFSAGGSLEEEMLLDIPILTGWSDCCLAPVYGETDVCSKCGEHCTVLNDNQMREALEEEGSEANEQTSKLARFDEILKVLNASAKQGFAAGGATGKKKLCPVGTEIQTLIFNKDKYSVEETRQWCWDNNMWWSEPDVTEKSIRIRQHDPDKFRRDSFRTITLKPGHIKAVIGCPKTAHRSFQTGGEMRGTKFLSRDGKTAYWAEQALPGSEFWSVVMQVEGYPETEAHDDWFASKAEATMVAMELADEGEHGGMRLRRGGQIKEKAKIKIVPYYDEPDMPGAAFWKVVDSNGKTIDKGFDSIADAEMWANDNGYLPDEEKNVPASVEQSEHLQQPIVIKWKDKQYPARTLIIDEGAGPMIIVVAGESLKKALKKSKLVGKAGELHRDIFWYLDDKLIKDFTPEEIITRLIHDTGNNHIKLVHDAKKDGGELKKYHKEKKEPKKVVHLSEATDHAVRISKPLATKLIKSDLVGKNMFVMCKEMGTGDNWYEIMKSDLVNGQIPSAYKTFEVMVEGDMTEAECRKKLQEFIVKHKIN